MGIKLCKIMVGMGKIHGNGMEMRKIPGNAVGGDGDNLFYRITP